MITAAAVCPHPPLLFRELTGRRDVAAELRAACLSAVAAATSSDPDVVVVVGGDEVTGSWDSALPARVRRFGTTGGADRPGLPLSLGVARRLLDESGWRGRVEMHTVAWTASVNEVTEVTALAARLSGHEERVALLVLGEGSTRRGDKAPGYLDERAFPFDDAIGNALASGDLDALAGMDAGLAEELMVSCRAPFAVLASVVRGGHATPRTKLLYEDDPFGVMYFVAAWDLT